MPLVAPKLSIEDILVKEQLMGDDVSSNGQSSLRSSRSSLIKRKWVPSRSLLTAGDSFCIRSFRSGRDVRRQWLPMAFAMSLFGILATVTILLALAYLAIRRAPCEQPSASTTAMLREDKDRVSVS